jgi:hypothetical protein
MHFGSNNKEYPYFMMKNNEFMKISLSSLGGYSHEEENKHVDKIMRNVLKEVTVDKNVLTDA